MFTTRNPKNFLEDKPRAIECQVINKKVDKKNFEREIVVTQILNYDEEIKWILPMFSTWVQVSEFAPFLAFTYCPGVYKSWDGAKQEEQWSKIYCMQKEIKSYIQWKESELANTSTSNIQTHSG